MRIILGHACQWTGVLAWAERRSREGLTILCYHRILPAEQKRRYFAPDLVVSPEALCEHCRTLRTKFRVLPLGEALHAWRRERREDRPLAAVTFDDGYQDNFAYARPVLAEHDIRATFFVVAGLVGTRRRTWFDQLGRAVSRLLDAGEHSLLHSACTQLAVGGATMVHNGRAVSPVDFISLAKLASPETRREIVKFLSSATSLPHDGAGGDRLMGWRELADLAAAGHEIGSHGMTHELLPQLDDGRLRYEVTQSRELIEKRIGGPVRAFCYPNGEADERVVRAVRAAGYRCAVTAQWGVNKHTCGDYRLRRWFIHEKRLADLDGKPSATLLRMEMCSLADRIFGRAVRRARSS